MATDKEVVLPRAGDVWAFKPEGDECKVERVHKRRGVAGFVVDVVHPLQILHERRLDQFLAKYSFVSSAGLEDIHAAIDAIRRKRGG